MPNSSLAQSLLLPELKLTKHYKRDLHRYFIAVKESEHEYCPKCATECRTIYDHRTVRVKDSPVRNHAVTLILKKRRFFCTQCKKPFMEYISGIKKFKRTTERYKSHLLWACENFSDLKRVKSTLRCSSGYLYKTLYEQLELERKKKLYPWPKTIGIDEHSFKRNKQYGFTEFASMIVDYPNKRVLELVEGKTANELLHSLTHIKERHNVENVIIDLCEAFRNFAKEYFPQAHIIADKFHVLKLLTPVLNKKRKAIVGDRRTHVIGRLLLRNGYRLDYHTRMSILDWLCFHPELKEIYQYKEALHRFYRIKGYRKAHEALIKMTDQMASSKIKEIQTLRKTLIKWREEILAYFFTGLTNGRTEGFNNLAKLVQRRAFGYKNFNNYRLRLLNACA